MVNNKSPKILAILNKIFLGLFIIIVLALISFFVLSQIYLAPVNPKSETNIKFTVENGWGKNKIANELKKKDLIKSSLFFKFYIRLNIQKEFYAGTYIISKSMNVEEIISLLNSHKSLENQGIDITFVEGKRLAEYVTLIQQKFVISEDEIYTKLNDEVYLRSLMPKYWFITESIFNDQIYQPLEGYLFPDTYTFKQNATIEDIIEKMLDNMKIKLDIYKEDIAISKYNIHELLTLASLVELEGAKSNDRAGIAAVFYNRLAINMTLGSDVTTYYAVNKPFTKDLTKSDLNSCNGYNTRGSCVTSLPVGPIASPSLSAISATIEPGANQYYFFVTDKFGQTYFNKTVTEHENTVAALKSEGKWYEY